MTTADSLGKSCGLNFRDSLAMTGDFEIWVFKNGVEIEHYREHNMIMASARDALARLIGGDGSGKVITQIGVGVNQDGPAPEDEKLTDAYVKNVSGCDYPATGEARFSFVIGAGEANGMAIREFGLLCSDGTLFARRTRGVIEKADDIEIAGAWTIKF